MTQHAIRIHSHLWLVWLCHIFPHYVINGTIFDKMLLSMKCVFWISLQLWSKTFLILRRIQRDITNIYTSSCKVPVILVRFSKNAQTSSFKKIRPLWEKLFHASRQTDMTKLTVNFGNFANAPKKQQCGVIIWGAIMRPQHSNEMKVFGAENHTM
jgi:hypothetical protein